MPPASCFGHLWRGLGRGHERGCGDDGVLHIHGGGGAELAARGAALPHRPPVGLGRGPGEWCCLQLIACFSCVKQERPLDVQAVWHSGDMATRRLVTTLRSPPLAATICSCGRRDPGSRQHLLDVDGAGPGEEKSALGLPRRRRGAGGLDGVQSVFAGCVFGGAGHGGGVLRLAAPHPALRGRAAAARDRFYLTDCLLVAYY